MTDKTGGPAFPNVPDGAGDKWDSWDEGMTLRDYFAAKAMQGLLSDPDAGMLDDDMNRWAMLSYKMADAMLRAREK